MAKDIKVSEFIVNELSEEKLQELKDTNSIPPNEMFLTDEEGEQFARGLPLGAVIPLAVVTDDPYLQPLDGRSLAQDGIYAEFCTWLKNRVLANSSNVPTCTIEEYATEMATYLQSGKFVINDTSETVTSGNFSVPGNSIKLPTITEFIASNNGGDAIGLAQLDEFKSHNHTTLIGGGDISTWGSAVEKGGTYEDSYAVGYTGGEETRPKNIRYPYYIVVATSTKTDVQVNLDNVANDINNINTVLSKTEQVEVIYDMYSNDPDINLGYSGGIPSLTTINFSSTQLSKYKRLICTLILNFTTTVFEVDLAIKHQGDRYDGGGFGIIVNDSNIGTIVKYGTVSVTADKASLTVHAAFYRLDTSTDYNDREGYFCAKIEGVY